MDHLPLPNDPVIDIECFYIPFLSHEEYDGESLKFYPDRKGWSYVAEAGHATFKYHGKRVSNSTQIASFLQTWLYFGFLSEVTRKPVDSTRFRKETTSGHMRVDSSILGDIIGSWSKQVVEESWSSDPVRMQRWVDFVYGTVLHVREMIVNTAAAEWRGLMSNEVILVCLGISVLGEYIGQALKQACLHRKLKPPATESWWSLLLPNSPADPLLDLMETKGWCPNRIIGLQLRYPRSLGMLWYFANMAPPKAHTKHLGCTPELCTLLQVDLRRYKTLHGDMLCGCPYQGPSADALATATEKGIVSLVTIAYPSGSTQVEVTLQERHEDCAYVAISHVWADGKGNLLANTLPQCVLRDLQDCANALSAPDAHNDMPFWIDTLCLPREPLELRRKGVAFLSDAFKYAAHVLVIDSYLRSFHVQSMAPIEVLARIISSDWNRRLWTLAEARLGRRVWVQFKDQAVEISGVVEHWKNTFSQIPCLPSIHVANHILEHLVVTTPLPNEVVEATLRQISQLRLALQTRTTSWEFDEPICLSIIMGLETRKIVEAPNEQKMEVLWSLISDVPSGLAFSSATRKLSSPGYRWAPRSLIGDLKLKHPWGGPENLFARHDARATPCGLEVKLPGILFKASSITGGISNETAKSVIFQRYQDGFRSFVLRDVSGYWYRITVGRIHEKTSTWHQNPASMDIYEDEPAIILDSAPTDRSFVTKTDAEVRPVGGALLVTYSRSEAGAPVLHVKAHTHALVGIESKIKTALLEKYKSFYDSLSGRISEGAFRASKIMHDEIRSSFEDYARKSGLLDLEREEQLGSDWNDQQVLDLALRRLEDFINVGPYREVQTVPESTVWCID